MFKNKPLFFINFLFFQHTVFYCNCCVFWKHYKNSVFRKKHSFSKTHSPMSKNTFFKRKVSFLVLGNFRWNHYFYSVSWFALFWAKTNFGKTDSVHENARFSSVLTQIVSGSFCKNLFFFFDFSHSWMITLKNTIFIGFFCLFHFLVFSFFCFYFCNKKQKEKTQNLRFSFRIPRFWHPPNFAKTLFWHNVTLFVFINIPPKHYKHGENSENLDQFLTLSLDQFLTLKPPKIGPVFIFTAYIYIHTYTRMCR